MKRKYLKPNIDSSKKQEAVQTIYPKNHLLFHLNVRLKLSRDESLMILNSTVKQACIKLSSRPELNSINSLVYYLIHTE